MENNEIPDGSSAEIAEAAEERLIRPRFVMIGGFLGAGKTTAILKFARWLRDSKGLRVGIITNDQAEGLVDTTLAKGAAFATSEIAGGCFCCKSDALLQAADELTDRIRPDVFIAEPVGSCTDLVATVSLPLSRIYRRSYEIAPMTVVVDPLRALRVLQEEPEARSDGGFTADINYIYRKQLEEAEVIALNKVDVVPKARLERIKDLIRRRYPSAQLIEVSARHGTGLEEWFETLMTQQLAVTRLMEVDYERYGRGEANLGWFNGTYSARAIDGREFDGNKVLAAFAAALVERFSRDKIEVAHFKATLAPTETRNPSGSVPLSAIQWVASDRRPETTAELPGQIHEGTATINLRAEADPDRIAQIVEDLLNGGDGVQWIPSQANWFRPGQPNPIHRVTDISDSSAQIGDANHQIRSA